MRKLKPNWIDISPTITKRYNIKIHFSTKLTPFEASSRKNEGYVYKNLLDKRKRIKPKFQVNDLVRAADLKKKHSQKEIQLIRLTFFFKITEIIIDTILSYYIDNLTERYN